MQPHVPEEVERLHELGHERIVQRAGRRDTPQTSDRVLRCHAGADRPHAREVVHDRDATVLDVEPPRMLAPGLHHEVAEEPGRRLQVERPPGHLTDERRPGPGPAHGVVECRLRSERAGHLPEVVTDRREDDGVRIGAVHPREEGVDELAQRASERRMHRHRVAFAAGDAGLFEPRRHPRRQVGEPGVGIGFTRDRVVDERVILIGAQGLFVTSGTAQREPCPGARWVAELVDRARSGARSSRRPRAR